MNKPPDKAARAALLRDTSRLSPAARAAAASSTAPATEVSPDQPPALLPDSGYGPRSAIAHPTAAASGHPLTFLCSVTSPDGAQVLELAVTVTPVAPTAQGCSIVHYFVRSVDPVAVDAPTPWVRVAREDYAAMVAWR